LFQVCEFAFFPTFIISRNFSPSRNKYLAIAVEKFFIGEDWTPKKKDVSLAMPTELDLTALQGTGLQPGEAPLPDDEVGGAAAAAAGAAAAPAINQELVGQLVEMGFHPEGCRRAAFHAPSGLEAAMEWVMAHMEDPDFTVPFEPPGAKKAAGGEAAFSEEQIMMITSMGFTEQQAKKALKATVRCCVENLFLAPNLDSYV
jgi:ubiquitin carboxyl-terminal hydrolase 5/13